MSSPPPAVRSEIGTLSKVLLHRPGRELETLTPQFLEELLFDDIPWISRMQEEHDLFANMLRKRGCEVFYYSDLLADILEDDQVKIEMVNSVLRDTRIPDGQLREDLQNLLENKSARELADILIGGLRKEEVRHSEGEKRLSYYIKDDFPYYLNPLPNLYFTRDPGAVISDGLVLSAMKSPVRSREPLILDFIRRHHPLFAPLKKLWYNLNDTDSVEGGDILVLSPHVILIGCSARSSSEGIERLAGRLLNGDSGIREVLALQIPVARAYMHLDTVFTMLDVDKFTIFPGVLNSLRVFQLTQGKKLSPRIKSMNSLDEALRSALKLPAVQLIQSGGGDSFTAAREQWNDSCNTLALSPGTVVAYKRNRHSNHTLHRHGIEVVEIEGSELVRGRGGPRCMSMPIARKPLE